MVIHSLFDPIWLVAVIGFSRHLKLFASELVPTKKFRLDRFAMLSMRQTTRNILSVRSIAVVANFRRLAAVCAVSVVMDAHCVPRTTAAGLVRFELSAPLAVKPWPA